MLVARSTDVAGSARSPHRPGHTPTPAATAAPGQRHRSTSAVHGDGAAIASNVRAGSASVQRFSPKGHHQSVASARGRAAVSRLRRRAPVLAA
jgi:hypothetical protein